MHVQVVGVVCVCVQDSVSVCVHTSGWQCVKMGFEGLCIH